jgi:GLPGLI family protein
MKRIPAILIGLLLTAGHLLAQHAHFTTSGTIEYERSVNMYAIIKKRITANNEAFFRPFLENYMKNNPQFKKLKSTLSFGGNKTLFTPIEDDSPSNNYFGDSPIATQSNTIYTDLNTDISIAQKKVFEETFLLKDSTRKIRWKITDETREIAGYTCRRANAIILDSIYVVAFYTTKIPVSGGPESFNGLPGMILGVALPHENITWFATKVTDTTLPQNTLMPPKEGKLVNNQSFKATLNGAIKNWGQWAQPYFKAFLL